MTAAPPKLDPDRCARSALPVALCDTCHALCPAGAIHLSDAGGPPHIDADLCIGCGACAASCPEAALSLAVPPPEPSEPRWSLVCSGASAASSYCLNAISLADLALASSVGVRQIEVADFACETCARAGAPAFGRTLERFNMLAASRGLKQIRLTRKAPQRRGMFAWLIASGETDPARRALLRGQGPTPGRAKAAALQRFQSMTSPSVPPRYVFAPAIDADLCSGCDACVLGCPTRAITIAASDPPAYEISAANCTGCGWCLALCAEDAIAVVMDAEAGADVSLKAFRCQSCNVEAHRPDMPKDETPALCHVCGKRTHSRPNTLVLK